MATEREELDRAREELERVRAEIAQCQRALERSRADLEHIRSAASHDLQEPLRMVTAYVQLLERRYRGKLGKDADEFIRFASDGAQRMSRMIQGLMAWFRVDSHGGEMVPTDSGHVLRGVLGEKKQAAEEKAPEFSIGVLPSVRADPAQLAVLLRHLIDNAVAFRGTAPPSVRIEARRDGDAWVFSVKDNGAGFDMQFAERIFEPFTRLRARDETSGIGMGLAVCRRIAERHGGRIWAQSEPGNGSTFFFTLPDAG